MTLPEIRRNRGYFGKIIFWGIIAFLIFKFVQTDTYHQLKQTIVDAFYEAKSDIEDGSEKRGKLFEDANDLF